MKIHKQKQQIWNLTGSVYKYDRKIIILGIVVCVCATT